MSAKSLLEYDRPALDWEREALPIGNGRLGAMLLGPPERSELWFNEISLWTGGENPSGEFDDEGFGNYQAFGTATLELCRLGEALEYRRVLDLASGIHTVHFRDAGGTRYEQQAFASHPAELIVVRLESGGPRLLEGSVRLAGAHADRTRTRGSHRLWFEGVLGNGLEYHAELAVCCEGGTVSASADRLAFSGCRTLTLLLAGATNYACDPARGWRGTAAAGRVAAALERGTRQDFSALRAAHAADHERWFGRADVELGASAPAVRARPLDERLASYRPGADPELVATLFRYGRYLLLASSRPGGLPANLQGLWNRSNQPPWHADYHTNVNVQMNYWLAEPANLPECHEPLFDLLDAMIPACRRSTQREFGSDVPGFTYRTSHNIFGGQGWEWNAPANAWYALHYYEHFAFGGDREFLKQRAWPYLAEASEFWLHRLKRREDGRLVAPDGWSPEHGPREDGTTYDQQLVAELFSVTLAAAEALALEAPLVARVRSALSELLGPRIGRFGQLQEWVEDRDDPDDEHRHASHLVGVFPGRQISVTRTPELARAAEVSLRARGESGDSRRSWTWPWRAALWARLRARDGHRMLDGYIAHNLLPNLIATHPPLQLDGSFGITAAIAEMLLQSHAGEIDLLPGVDLELWPNGSFRGLRARGGFEVSASWREGLIVEAELRSRSGGGVELRAPCVPVAVTISSRSVPTRRTPSETLRFQTEPGECYRIQF